MQLSNETLAELRDLYEAHDHPTGETCLPTCPIRTLYFGAAGFAAGLVFLEASLAGHNPTIRNVDPAPALRDLAEAHPIVFDGGLHAQRVATSVLAHGYLEAAGI